MLEKATSCLVDVDFFGKFYYFTFNKENRYTSAIGGIISLGVALGFLIALWFLGKEIIFRESPTVVFNYELDAERYNRNLHVPFAFVIENLNGVVLDNYEKYFSFTALHINFSKTDITKDYTIIRQNIPMRKCLTTDFTDDPIIQKSYIDNNLKFAYCLDYSNQTIGGSWGQLWNFYVNVTLEPCTNSSTKNSCATNEEIKYYIVKREIQISMYYEDMVLTTTHNTKPLTKYMRNDHQRIQLNTAKTNEYFLQDVVVTTDNGWITPYKSQLSTQILTTRFFDFYNNNDQFTDDRVIAAVSMNIFASVNKYEVLRTYLKLQDVLAQLGGILKVVFMFFEGLFYLVYSHRHEEILIRNLFRSNAILKKEKWGDINDKRNLNIKPPKLDEITVKSSNPSGPIKKEDNISNLEKKFGDSSMLNTSNQLMINKQADGRTYTVEDTNLVKVCNNDNDQNSELVEKAFHHIFSKKSKFSEDRFVYNYAELLTIVFCPCIARPDLKKREKMFRHLVEHTKKYSDGLSVIKSVYEVEKIKHVILDEKQLALFSIMSEPKNPLDSFEGELKLFSSNKEKLLNAEIARNYLSELKIKRNLTFTEKRLLDLCHK